MEQIQTHRVPKQNAPTRLQEYGVGIFSLALTKSALKKALKNGFITVNNKPATTATYIIGGEQLVLRIPKKPQAVKQLNFPLQVLYQDSYLAAINKPPGIAVSGNSFKTITNALAQNLNKSPLPDATPPQPVHRLDYPTTGVLLIGKTSSSIRQLNALFSDKIINKTYYAITYGAMPDYGVVNLPIDKKPAITNFRVIARVTSVRFNTLNLVILEPKTGRRHQIRKHLASLDCPILGDKDYGKPRLILKGKGLYLHAQSLEFKHPFTQKQVLLSCEIPKKFLKIFPEFQVESTKT